MEHRYIGTITDLKDAGQVKVVVVDQKHSKVIHDSVSSAEMLEEIRKMLDTLYGSEIKFIEKEGHSTPWPYQV